MALPEFWNQIPEHSQHLQEWIALINQADYVGVRGPLSASQLREWGVQALINVIGDPALYFAEAKVQAKVGRRVLGVSAGSTKNLLWGDSDETFWDGLLEQLETLGECGWSFVLFHVMPGDALFAELASERLRKYSVRTAENYLSPEHFLKQLREVDVFVGEKLHATILAICAHTPSIMREYRPKCRDFMLSLDLEDRLIRTDEIEHAMLVDRVEDLYNSRRDEQERLFSRTQPMKQRLVDAMQEMVRIATT